MSDGPCEYEPSVTWSVHDMPDERLYGGSDTNTDKPPDPYYADLYNRIPDGQSDVWHSGHPPFQIDRADELLSELKSIREELVEIKELLQG